VRAYSAAEIAQGAKSGQWAALNQQNGAGLNTRGASSFPTRAEAEALATPAAVALKDVTPAQKMVTHDLGPIRINRPDNWPVTLPEQQGQFVMIAPKAGVTKNGVGYGVMLNGAPAPSERMSVDDMTNALIAAIQQNNQLEQINKPQPITVGGLEGRSTFLRSHSPFPDGDGQPLVERDWLVTVPRNDGSMIFMIFIAPEADFARLQPAYDAMVKSVQFK
jgi:hypothetical protein